MATPADWYTPEQLKLAEGLDALNDEIEALGARRDEIDGRIKELDADADDDIRGVLIHDGQDL